MSLALHLTLNPSIVDLAYFLTVKPSPLLIIKSPIESLNILKFAEINESIANIALIKEVNRKIEKVEFVLEFSIYGRQHLLLGILIGYVSDHKSRPSLRNDFSQVNLKPIIISHPLRRSPNTLKANLMTKRGLSWLPDFLKSQFFL